MPVTTYPILKEPVDQLKNDNSIISEQNVSEKNKTDNNTSDNEELHNVEQEIVKLLNNYNND